MKRLFFYLCSVIVLGVSCKKDKDGDDGPLPMKETPASFRGLTATVDGATINAVTDLKVTRINGDPSLGILPGIRITGYMNEKRLEVGIRWDAGATPKTGEYPLTFDTDKMHYYASVLYDQDINADIDEGIFFSSSGVSNNDQRGKINVVVLDAHTFVGSFSATAESHTENRRQIINGQFGGTY